MGNPASDLPLYSSRSLVTIYTSSDWYGTVNGVDYAFAVFTNCKSLVGGNGTKYTDSSGTYVEKEIERGNSRKGRRIRILAAVFFILIGIGLLGYPWISNWLYENQTHSTYSAYADELTELGSEELANQLAAVREYNESLKIQQPGITNPFNSTAWEMLGDDAYWNLLCTGNSEVMAYLEIPAISVYLPVYHGTDDSTLSAGIGHMEGSSLPVGGESTHAVLTGHSGLTGKKLFTDLSELEEGDYFYIHVLGETLAYRVCRIQTVLPDDLDTLRIEDGKDLVTLMTCTPYGINSHRLLVTGERVEYSEETYEASEVKKTSTVSRQWVKDYEKAAVTAVCILLFLLAFRAFLRLRKKNNNRKKETDDGEDETI